MGKMKQNPEYLASKKPKVIKKHWDLSFPIYYLEGNQVFKCLGYYFYHLPANSVYQLNKRINWE